MTDRLTIINDALFATGNNQVNAEYDGSDEWIAVDSAYRRALSSLLSEHRWSFATKTASLGGRLAATPSGYERFQNAFAFPADFMHLKAAYVGGVPFTEFEIVDQTFCCSQTSGVTIEYVRTPTEGQFPPGFVEILTMKVEAYLLRGLNEDTDNARRRDADVENKLAMLRSASDQQTPGRAVMRSRTAARRAGYGRGASRWPGD